MDLHGVKGLLPGGDGRPGVLLGVVAVIVKVLGGGWGAGAIDRGVHRLPVPPLSVRELERIPARRLRRPPPAPSSRRCASLLPEVRTPCPPAPWRWARH